MLFVFQLLAIVGSAAFAGVMLAIALILGPVWRSLPPADFLSWFAANSGIIARTIPVVLLPTVAGMVGSLMLSWTSVGSRNLWLAAIGCIAVLLVLTVAYFFPMNASFSAGSVPIEDVADRLDAWLAMHWVRIALAILAAGLGLSAVPR